MCDVLPKHYKKVSKTEAMMFKFMVLTIIAYWGLLGSVVGLFGDNWGSRQGVGGVRLGFVGVPDTWERTKFVHVPYS